MIWNLSFIVSFQLNINRQLWIVWNNFVLRHFKIVDDAKQKSIAHRVYSKVLSKLIKVKSKTILSFLTKFLIF